MKRIILVIIVALLVSGCTGISGKKKAETAEEAHKGTRGLTLSFLQNAPPATMYVEEGVAQQLPYQVVLDVKNEGAYTTSSEIHLLGFDRELIGLTERGYMGNIEGRSPQNPDGGHEQFLAEIASITLPPGTDTLSFNLLIAACYPYKTEASLPVCIDPDPFGVVVAKACMPGSVPTGGGQGAPVAITSVQQESLPNKAIFKMTVSNVGGGQVYSYPPMVNCMDLAYSEIDRVSYSTPVIGSNIIGDCSPRSPLVLTNGRATLTCIFNIPQNQAFTSALNIELDYGYTNTMQKMVKIKKI